MMNDVLRLDGVTVRRDGKLVLDRVSLDVAAGELVVVEGARGAGKTLLCAVAAAALRPDAGSVFVGGKNVTSLQAISLPYVRRNVGYLPAEPPLLTDESVLENVLLPLAVRGVAVASAIEGARRALRALGVGHLADEIAGHLSAGERRLVALSRAFAGAPVLVVLDEPTAGLDPDDRDKVVAALLATQASGAAVLVGAADPALVDRLAHDGARRVRLEGGRLIGGAPRIALVVGGDDEDAPRKPDVEGEAELGAEDLEPVDDAEGAR